MNSLAKALKNKVVSKTADVLSTPKRVYNDRKRAAADADTMLIKKARSYDKAPDFNKGVPTDAFKTRTLARAIKGKYSK